VKSKKKFIIFDLDGVICDSKNNMEFAWNETAKKFNLNIKFNEYFRNIGIPFFKILEKLEIKPEKKIYDFFKKSSIKKINLIKPFKNVQYIFDFLKKKKIRYSIVTSKDLYRTKLLLKKFKIQPCSIHCPNKKLRGKPYPDHLLNCMKKNNVKPNDTCFVGDTMIDYLAAKKANILFIFAKYGYGKNKKLYKNTVSNFKQIIKFINF
jgi:phosphoglycolate phosphatase